MKSRLLGATFVVASLLLAACGTPSAGPPAPADSAAFNTVDVQFLQAAIPAHSEAIAMGRLAEQRAASEGVRLFGRQVVNAQTLELEDMTRLLESWGYAVDEPLQSGSGVPTLTREADIALLSTMAGSAFDAQFLTSMEQHHERVLAAARNAEAAGRSSELRAITDLIIRSQAFEIEQINALRNKPSPDDQP